MTDTIPSTDTLGSSTGGFRSKDVRTDDAVWASIAREEKRQQDQLELIASENHASPEVIAAMGTALTNKYAEGYPGRRYYGGCEFVDEVEDLARDRARELFGSERANVQPHSGTQANMAAFMALIDPGDKVLAMSLDHGGHLSHGHPKNFSGVFYEFHSYGVEKGTERVDMDQVRDQAKAVRPKLLLAGASAYSRPLDFAAFAEIAREVDALLMVDMAHIAGLVAGGVHESPVPHADVVTLTTHKTLRGPRGGMILCPKDRIVKINSALFPGGQGGPLMHVIAAKAIAFREAQQDSFKAYAAQVVRNASVLADTLTEHGIRIVSGGTDNHVMLVDVGSIGLSGAAAEDALHRVDITCNKNLIPFDERPPMEASGVRLGTAAITTRGLDEGDMKSLGGWIAETLKAPEDEAVIGRVRGAVAELTGRKPIYH
ncbi:Serine hydroxymethyltransferase [Planctomycetes bacterium Poly30]|uniref:Serine hydroxymethyltransferase n=1 Tax=Saltatorellus ferox TaxID=2528018 RepID=A0A518ETJ3_9BACT|nr:Serine hydroxymethyltransferase [Planctomycetes bacterium Poly30]